MKLHFLFTLYFYRKNRENSITFRTSRKNLLDILEQIKYHYSFMNSNGNYNNPSYG